MSSIFPFPFARSRALAVIAVVTATYSVYTELYVVYCWEHIELSRSIVEHFRVTIRDET